MPREFGPRIPLAPGIMANRENLAAIVNTLRRLGASDLALLPYNPLGLAMYQGLGGPAPDLPAGFTKPEREKLIGPFLST